MAVIVGNQVVTSDGTSYSIAGRKFPVGNLEHVAKPAVSYVMALIRGVPIDDLVQSLLEEEGLVQESWHRKIGYWAGMVDEQFGETEWTDELDSQRDSRLLEDEFIHGGQDDVD